MNQKNSWISTFDTIPVIKSKPEDTDTQPFNVKIIAISSTGEMIVAGNGIIGKVNFIETTEGPIGKFENHNVRLLVRKMSDYDTFYEDMPEETKMEIYKKYNLEGFKINL